MPQAIGIFVSSLQYSHLEPAISEQSQKAYGCAKTDKTLVTHSAQGLCSWLKSPSFVASEVVQSIST